MSAKLTIGALSAQTHCPIATIRYYEEIGLLPRAARAANGHRHYREADLKRLTFIKRCRDFGFPIEQVRDLAKLFENGEQACSEVRDLAQEHLLQVRTKIEELRQLEASLAGFVGSCDANCRGGLSRDCVILEDMAARDGAGSTSPFIATELKRN
jgi:DNA-binding transcriptional MerR regulator